MAGRESAARGAADMSLGSKHDEHGMLLREGRDLVLMLDGGGRWRLDADPGADKLSGQRVRVEGTRTGFDILSVTRLSRC